MLGVNAMIVGKVKDVGVNFQSKILKSFIVGERGILESLKSSKNDIIILLNMLVAVEDK